MKIATTTLIIGKKNIPSNQLPAPIRTLCVYVRDNKKINNLGELSVLCGKKTYLLAFL